MTTKNLAVFLDGARVPYRLGEAPVEEPKQNEVLLEMHSVGLCGTDLHVWEDGGVFQYKIKDHEPNNYIIGHESSGTVVKVGPNVTHLKPGDRVAIEPTIPCRTCTNCKTGRYNLCPDLNMGGLPTFRGTMRRLYTHTADFCYKLPDNVSLEEGALMEPFAVAVHACRRGNVSFGQNVLVCGAGPIGMVCTIAAKALGVKKIVVTDIVDSRLEFARKNGADAVINVKGKSQTEVVKLVHEALGAIPDVTLECTGAEVSIDLGIAATKAGGRVCVVGLGPEKVAIPIARAVKNEIDVIGCLIYPNCFPVAIEMVASGKANIKPLISHRYKMEDINKAFNTFQHRLDNALKVVIQCFE